ncbi:MAG TPA: amino acid racemase, partial [Acidobacteriota bacterium]|nr:amino acid racemase [Acidobacteriota bacterium]
MSRKKLLTIGILGGMGPEAGAHFFERIIHETAAKRDQDHPPVIIYSLPQVPDRTRAILHGGPSPVPALRRGLRTLQRAGAAFAVIPCISAHYFYPRIAPRSPIPLLNLIDETLAAIKKMKPVPKTIGLIATSGTVRSGVVARTFKEAGIAVIVPSA